MSAKPFCTQHNIRQDENDTVDNLAESELHGTTPRVVYNVNVAVDVIENESKTTRRLQTNIIKANC